MIKNCTILGCKLQLLRTKVTIVMYNMIIMIFNVRYLPHDMHGYDGYNHSCDNIRMKRKGNIYIYKVNIIFLIYEK